MLPLCEILKTTSEDVKVTEVTGTDFVVTPSGSNLTVAAIGRNGSDTNFANKFEVTVSGYATDYQGDISLALVAGKGSYTDPAGNPEASSQSPSIEKYVRDVTPPDYNDPNSLVEIKNTSVQNNPDIATATTVNQNGGVGDTIVAKLTVPASENDLGSVEFDFSDFGGDPVNPTVVTTKTTASGNDTYQATFVITAGSENAMEGRVQIKAIDKAGNSQTFTDDQYMVIDRVAPNADSNRDISGVDAAKTHAGANDYFTTESELVYKVVFTESVNNVSADDFTVVGAPGFGLPGASNLFIKSLTPIGTDLKKEFTIVVAGSDIDTINSAAGQGVGVEFTGSNNIIDASGNELVSTAPAVTQLYVVDNAAPVFTSAATANIDEDIAADSVAYDANTTDVAGGVVYTLKEVGDHADFSINDTTGVVTIDASPIHEAKETYTFTVQATDRFGFQSEKAVTLTINDLNEMPNIAITPNAPLISYSMRIMRQAMEVGQFH